MIFETMLNVMPQQIINNQTIEGAQKFAFFAAQSNDKEMGRGRCIDDRSHHLLLGRLSPLWIPDEDAEECMMCR